MPFTGSCLPEHKLLGLNRTELNLVSSELGYLCRSLSLDGYYVVAERLAELALHDHGMLEYLGQIKQAKGCGQDGSSTHEQPAYFCFGRADTSIVSAIAGRLGTF